ncbi:SIMPL domain-containing protein [uncultured Ferrimonas sp.]|uniref:SIMPL domain-containing protein n=1 Tax=uncultured Ferrimonas sp. TaxID=432640 RepID=UPI00261ECDB1|nr:SIMPL domain-containing protein [uncultured Ferrimonas sp.]
MEHRYPISAAIVGVCLVLGLGLLGQQIGSAAIAFKQLERSVKVKGLSEQEVQANIVIWPIEFSAANNQLEGLYQGLDKQTEMITAFLLLNGITAAEITVSSPAITDKSAQQYGNTGAAPFRFTALQTVTVYSNNIDGVRAVMGKLSQLGKQGIVFTGGGYQARTEYLFTQLNDIKPKMIEQATRKAREVAEKFAADSQSQLGKIKRAAQGQFSINARDNNNPHIKKVRVVATIEYYLSD